MSSSNPTGDYLPPPDLNNGKDRGKSCEGRVFRSILTRRNLWPHYILSIRKATKTEDKTGVDMIVTISHHQRHTSTIPIQIKSSKRQAQRFKSSHPNIYVILGSRTEANIFLRFIDIVQDFMSRLADHDYEGSYQL